MSGRTNIKSDADRISQRLMITIGEELRDARMLRGISQAAVGRHIGVSRHRVGRVERRKATTLSIGYLSRHAAAVGLRLSVKLYPAGGGVRDAAQARYIARFVERIGTSWRVALEATVPLPGDLRAVDVLLDGPCRICVEVITRLRDLQAQIRAAQLKQRDIGASRLIIVVAGTHANRRALEDLRGTLLATFDLDTRRTFALLSEGRDPGRDAIVVLD